MLCRILNLQLVRNKGASIFFRFCTRGIVVISVAKHSRLSLFAFSSFSWQLFTLMFQSTWNSLVTNGATPHPLEGGCALVGTVAITFNDRET